MEEKITSLKANEYFIEGAYLIKGGKAIKMKIGKVIQKRDRDTYALSLRQEYGVDRVQLIKIERN